MTLEVSKGYKRSTMNEERTLQHLTMMVEKGLYFPEFIPDAKSLRSVVSYGDGGSDYAVISKKAMSNLFNQARRLRLMDMDMDMAGYHGSTIPEEIRNLVHLR
ncbi:hypothetical protein SLE2022_206690 [Rubroshorea leprosula]